MSTAWAALKARLDRGETILLDGAIGTELDRRGAPMNPDYWCAEAAFVDYDTLVDVHRDYIAAGADIITANTYSASPLMLKGSPLESWFEELIARTLAAVQEARRKAGREEVAIAGSLSHMAGGLGKTQAAAPSLGEMTDAFGRLAERLRAEGADLILMEMMYLPERIGAIYHAGRANGMPLWAGFSVRAGTDGKLFSFASERDIPFTDLLDLAADWKLDAAGVMHSKADVTGPALRALAQMFDVPLYAYPDSGRLDGANWSFGDTLSPEELAGAASGWRRLGAQALGGCCGFTAEHIRALRKTTLQ